MSRKKALRIAACIHSIYNDCTPDSFSKRLVRQVMNNDIVQEGSGGRRDREGRRDENRHRGNVRGLRRIAKVYGRENTTIGWCHVCGGGGPGEASDLSSRGYSSAGME